MTHPLSYSPGQLIRSADVNRSFELLRNAIDVDSAALLDLLEGRLNLEDLTPALQALVLKNLVAFDPLEQHFTGDGSTTVFTLSSIPSAGSLTVFLNGQLLTSGVDYTVSGVSLTFAAAPFTGDDVTARFTVVQATTAIIVLGGFQLPYEQVIQTLPTLEPIVQQFFSWGTNKTSGFKEVAKFEAVGLSQLGAAVLVDGGLPDATAIVMTTSAGQNFLWAIGAPAGGTHRVVKVDVSTMLAAATVAMNDPTTVVTSLATDNGFVYAFMKGGSTLQANSVQKFDAVTNLPVAVIGPGTPGITTTGFVDTVISQAGALYVSYSDVNGGGSGEVRKFDATTGALLERFVAADFGAATIRPIRLVRVMDNVHVLDDLNQKIYKLSALDVVTTVATLSFVPTDLTFDASDLWVSSADTLYKVDLAGSVLDSAVPQAGRNIQDVMSGLGLIWTSFSNDTNPADQNVVKIFPGLPGV
jgi:hypothetical protein